jgi:predicted MFS family arabinose efflux permease
MRGLWSMMALIGAGRFIALLARMSIVPFYPELMAAYAVGYTGVGAMFSAFFVGYSAMLVPAGLGADRYNPLRQMAVGLTLLAAGGALVVWAPVYWMALVARGIEGAAVALLFTAGLKLVAVQFGPQQRGKAVGLMEIATGAGTITAMSIFPALSGWIGYQSLLMSVAVISLLTLALLAFTRTATNRASQRTPAAQPGESARRSLFNTDLLFITLTIFLGLFAFNGVLGWLPTYLMDGLGFNKAQAGVVTAVVLGSQILGVLPGGVLSDRIGRRLPVVHVGSVAMLTGFLLLLPAGSGPLLYVAAVLLGFGAAWGITPLVVLTTEMFGAERAGLVGAITVAISQVGSGMAGVILGWVLDVTGAFWVIWVVAAVLAAVRLVTGSLIGEGRGKGAVRELSAETGD